MSLLTNHFIDVVDTLCNYIFIDGCQGERGLDEKHFGFDVCEDWNELSALFIRSVNKWY